MKMDPISSLSNNVISVNSFVDLVHASLKPAIVEMKKNDFYEENDENECYYIIEVLLTL